MYCKNCGMPVDAQKDVCPHCGTRLRDFHPTGDASSTGFAVLCFFFPLIGLILYLVWQKDFPLKAKSCGKGALAGVITEVVITILTVIFYVIILSRYIAAGGV